MKVFLLLIKGLGNPVGIKLVKETDHIIFNAPEKDLTGNES
jgi:hypothetical protein